MTLMIEGKKLTKKYGQQGGVCRALDEVDLEIAAGTFSAVMGPSGSGKTTLLNLISTIDAPSSGTVRINGRDIGAMKKKDIAMFRRQVVGFVFQEFNLLHNMTIRDNIALPLTLNNTAPDTVTARVQELTALLGIENQLEKYPYQLSGGQKQRAAVCRALIHKPDILLADEPTGALDSRSAAELLTCMQTVRNTYGTTIVMVTHDVTAASYCERVIFLKDGKLAGQLYASEGREMFFRKILNMVAMLGGETIEHL